MTLNTMSRPLLIIYIQKINYHFIICPMLQAKNRQFYVKLHNAGYLKRDLIFDPPRPFEIKYSHFNNRKSQRPFMPASILVIWKIVETSKKPLITLFVMIFALTKSLTTKSFICMKHHKLTNYETALLLNRVLIS